MKFHASSITNMQKPLKKAKTNNQIHILLSGNETKITFWHLICFSQFFFPHKNLVNDETPQMSIILEIHNFLFVHKVSGFPGFLCTEIIHSQCLFSP